MTRARRATSRDASCSRARRRRSASIRVGIDAVCAQGVGANVQSQAVLIAKDGALQNAFVYVKDGLDPSYSFDVPTTPVDARSEGLPVRAAHLRRARGPADRDRQQRRDVAQRARAADDQSGIQHGRAEQGARMTQTFTVPEVMVRFKCDVHAWMTAYVGVMAHPYFAVTRGRRHVRASKVCRPARTPSRRGTRHSARDRPR